MKIFFCICISLFLFIGCEQKPKKEIPQNININKAIDAGINYYIEGMTELSKGNIDEAIKNLEEQIKIKNDDFRTYLILAHLYMKSKDLEKAVNILEKAVGLKTKNPDIYFLLTQCYSQLDEDKKALEAIKVSIKIYEKNNNRTNYQNAIKAQNILNERLMNKCNKE